MKKKEEYHHKTLGIVKVQNIARDKKTAEVYSYGQRKKLWIPTSELTDKKESYKESLEKKRRSVWDFDPEKAREFLNIVSDKLAEGIPLTAKNDEERELLEETRRELIGQARDNIDRYDD